MFQHVTVCVCICVCVSTSIVGWVDDMDAVAAAVVFFGCVLR